MFFQSNNEGRVRRLKKDSPYAEHRRIIGNNQAHYIDVVNKKHTGAEKEIHLYDHDMNNGTYWLKVYVTNSIKQGIRELGRKQIKYKIY